MKATHDLFLLIRSLSKAEKRYFKIFTSSYSGNKRSVKLFDAMDRQVRYDEKKLKNIFFAGQSGFSWTKNYLYNMLLKSLASFHRKKSAGSEIKEMMEYAGVLFKKGLNSQSLKQIRKSKQLAQCYRKYALLYEIGHLEFAVLKEMGNTEEVKKLTLETTALIKKLENINHFKNRFTFLWLLYRESGSPRTITEVHLWKKYNRRREHKKGQPPLTATAKLYWYDTQLVFCRAAGDFKNACVWSRKCIKMMESLPGYVTEEIDHYIFALSEYLFLLAELKQTAACLAVIGKLKSLAANKTFLSYNKITANIFFNASVGELGIYYETGEYAKAAKMICKIEAGLEKYTTHISGYKKITLCYLIAMVYTASREYRKALWWINIVLDGAKERSDIQPAARILNVIIHYKLGNRETLDYVIRSAKRFLQKSTRHYRCETIVLSYIKKIGWLEGKKESIALLQDLKEKLLPALQDPSEKTAFAYFDIPAWIDEEIHGK